MRIEPGLAPMIVLPLVHCITVLVFMLCFSSCVVDWEEIRCQDNLVIILELLHKN